MYHENMTMMCGMKRHPHINMHGQYEFWLNPHYRHYIHHEGYHFNPHTLDVAMSKMVNRDGSHHKWSREEVSAAFEKMKQPLMNGYTLCDATYLANMFYADYFSSSIKTEQECLDMAADFMTDIDGYKGRIFHYWLSDIMVEGCVVDWEKMYHHDNW